MFSDKSTCDYPAKRRKKKGNTSIWDLILHSGIGCFVVLIWDAPHSWLISRQQPLSKKHRITWKCSCSYYLAQSTSSLRIQLDKTDRASTVLPWLTTQLSYPLRNENLWLQKGQVSTFLCPSKFPAYFAYNSKWSNLILIWSVFIFLSSVSEWYVWLRK